MPLLRITLGGATPYDVALDKDVYSIGRASTNALAFNNPWLSRQHAELRRDGENFILRDVGSRNGTYVNRVQIASAKSLSHGDLIELGDVTLRYMDRPQGLELLDEPTPLVNDATFILDAAKLDLKKYVEESKSGARNREAAEENLWPALNEAAATLIQHYPIEQLLNVVMDIVMRAVHGERGALMLGEKGGGEDLQLRVIRQANPDQPLRVSRRIVDEVVSKHRAVLTMDARSDQRFESSESIVIQGIRGILCVPLWNNTAVIGLIYVDSLVTERAFSQSDLRLLGLIANMAAVKVENLRLLDAEMERKRLEEQLALAAQIQRKLLPETRPTVAGYDIAASTRSCYEIGGDYYDFIERPGGKLGVVVADVAGKGVGAALIMAAFQASLRALADTDKGAAALMTQLNAIMRRNIPGNKFITVFYGELDIERHSFEYVNAGHNPPLLVDATGCRGLDACGPVLGLLPGIVYTSRVVTLAADALLCLYTDGVTEATDPGDGEFGRERLESFLAASRSAGVDDLQRRIEERLQEFTAGGRASDDTTVVFLRRTGS